MFKVFRFFEYAYLAATVFFCYEAYRIWNLKNDKAILYLGFGAVALFMFLFKRNFRKRIATNQKNH